MIKNIIFDIGQVLAAFRWKDYIKDLDFTKEIGERVAKATVLSPYWNELDKGEVAGEVLLNKCIALDPEIELPIRKFFEDTSRIVVEYDYSKPWILELKQQGYQIYILSNYGEDNWRHVENVFSFLPLVDGAVISYQEKSVKPEPHIYEVLLKRYDLKPQECIFIDDLVQNINGAKIFGISTVHFQNIAQAKEELQMVLVEENKRG